MTAPRYLIPGAHHDWEVAVGMEVHAQVASQSKLFSGASTEYGGAPNSHVSLVDAAMPGMLPVLNEMCVEQAVRTGLGLNAEINLYSRFDRKNYFYPDLPQGYQISQYAHPIVGEGVLEVELDDGSTIEVRIERIHLEQDAGKSIHDLDPKATFVDLNRSGVALMEIVSKPDLRAPAEGAAFLKKLRNLVRYLGTCDGDMEKGQMRADVNVPVRKPGDALGTRCEIKNVNSMRFVAQAIETEARRLIAILEDGGRIDQETRLYDPGKGETRSMRSKEEAHDYRYFPDPDLLPLNLDPAFVARIKADLPELPDAKKRRFVRDFGLTEYDAGVLAADKARAAYFENVAKGRDAKLAVTWVTVELFGYLNKQGLDVETSPVSAEDLGALVDLISDGTLSGKLAKTVFEKMAESGEAPGMIVEREGLKQVTDTGAIEKIIDDIMAANPAQVEQVKVKPKTMGWFVGQVMKASGGKANPQAVNQLLTQKLGLD
ncbi:MAG: Asp-tRNA(Asn)/Glu-tRNA(Gln) amidotransferase subunit GatB [Maricaulaceae bacterium]